MNVSTFDLIKKIILGIVFSAIVIIFATLLLLTTDDKFIKDLKTFIKTDTKVLYISNKKNYDEYPIKLFDKYEINYKYIDSEKISNFEKTKIERIINNRDLSSIIVIFESGKIKDALINISNEDELNKFLIKNEIIPSIFDDISGLVNKISNSVNSDSLILYLPYSYNEYIEYQDNLFKSISKQRNIEYKKLNAYLLSKTQHQKINSVLDISDVEDQIVLFIKDKKVVGSLRGYIRKSEFINKLFEYNYVEEVYNSLNEINYNEFESKVREDNRNILLIIKDDCKYCKETMSLLSQICSSKNIDIDFINIKDLDSSLSITLEEKIKSIGYRDGFSTPLLIITEKNKILDYSIGTSSIEFYEELFKEYGLIK